jgi:hypothetical protein
VAGTDNATWLDIDILVDHQAASPSDSDKAFCAHHGDGLFGNWVSAITTVVSVVPAVGMHTVHVQGTLRSFDPGDGWRIDDSTTVVTN